MNTSEMYYVVKKFGRDIAGIILDFFYQCDFCNSLEIGKPYYCAICSFERKMCVECYNIRSWRCNDCSCRVCGDCSQSHCLNSIHFWMEDW